jgi:peptidoglycan/LPS O-acetylase OafA/YrhL
MIWMLGAMVALYPDIKHKICLFFFGILLIAIGSVCWQFAWASSSIKTFTLLPIPVSEILMAQGFCFLIPILSNLSSFKIPRFFVKFSKYISAISYSLYLVHYPVLTAFNNIFPRATHIDAESLWHLLLRAVTAFAAANIMWYLFERNTPKARKFFRDMFDKSANPSITH